MAEYSSSNQNLQLVELLKQYFSLDEIKELCFGLGINFESIPGENTIDSKSRELVIYMSRRGQIDALLQKLRTTRPNVTWPEIEAPDQLIYFEEDRNWTQILKGVLEKWESNNREIKSLSSTAGQAAAFGAIITVIGTLLFLAREESQEQPEILFLVFVSLLFAGAAFIFSQLWARMLIAIYFVVEQMPTILQAFIITAVGGITGYFVFYTMVQTYVYSWVPAVVAGLILVFIDYLTQIFERKPPWLLPCLSALATMLISYGMLVYRQENQLNNAFGVIASGTFSAIFIYKVGNTKFIAVDLNKS